MSRLAFVIVFMFLLFQSASLAVRAEDEFEIQYVTPDKFLEIWSDHKIDQARCKSICDRVMKAYQFNAKQESWKNPELLYKQPLKFRVVGSIKSKVLGYAQGPNLMVVGDEYLDDPLSEGTLAHELTHIQDARQLNGGKLPSFMLEGRALTNGHSYRMSIGQAENSYDTKMANSAMRFTTADADEILNEMSGVGWNMQAMGTFLVEYMRTKWNGAGVADIHPKLSKMVERIATGVDGEVAFEKEFGMPFTALLESFKKYLNATSNSPTRIQGMMWQQTSAPQQASESDDDES